MKTDCSWRRGRAAAFAALLFLGTVVPAKSLWIDVPFVRQVANGCGSASLAMVISYWQGKGFALADSGSGDAVRIQKELYVASDNGIPAASMDHYLRDLGFETFVFRGEWQDLEHHLWQGRPLIVAIDGGASLHYAVATGIEDGILLLNDPAGRKLGKYSRDEFEHRWEATGHWTLLAVPGRR